MPFNRPVTPYYNQSNEDIQDTVVKPLQGKLDTLCAELNDINANIEANGGTHTDPYNM